MNSRALLYADKILEQKFTSLSWAIFQSRSGIPLALQNKAIRSGVPIGPFQTKRKRKLRGASQDAASSSGGGSGSGKARKRASLSGTGVAGTKKGDLEVINHWLHEKELLKEIPLSRRGL